MIYFLVRCSDCRLFDFVDVQNMSHNSGDMYVFLWRKSLLTVVWYFLASTGARKIYGKPMGNHRIFYRTFKQICYHIQKLENHCQL